MNFKVELASSAWLATYLAHGLECDMPILEAIWRVPQLSPQSLQEIWKELEKINETPVILFKEEAEPNLNIMVRTLEQGGWNCIRRKLYKDALTTEWQAYTLSGSQMILEWHDMPHMNRVGYRIHQHEQNMEESSVEFTFHKLHPEPIKQRSLWHALAADSISL